LLTVTTAGSQDPFEPEWLAFPPSARFVIEPDPAWDGADEIDGELVVEVSWLPDATPADEGHS
jgi:hypothetical protein